MSYNNNQAIKPLNHQNIKQKLHIGNNLFW